MKKLAVAGIILASALTMTACGSSSSNNGFDDGYSQSGGWTDHDWDMNYASGWNNTAYCHGGTYQPLAGNQYSCFNNGVTTPPSVRPAPSIPPKAQQAPPPAVQQKRQEITKQQTQQKQQQNSAPKQNTAPKAPAPPAPKAPPPAPKSGK